MFIYLFCYLFQCCHILVLEYCVQSLYYLQCAQCTVYSCRTITIQYNCTITVQSLYNAQYKVHCTVAVQSPYDVHCTVAVQSVNNIQCTVAIQ